jgi:hypothetical protein
LALMVVVVALMVVVVVVVMVSPESLFRTSSARVTHGRSPALYVRTSFPLYQTRLPLMSSTGVGSYFSC